MNQDDATTLSILARLSVVERFLRAVFVSAMWQRISAEELLQMAEDAKVQAEDSELAPEAASFKTAAIDNFFNALAADLRARQSSSSSS